MEWSRVKNIILAMLLLTNLLLLFFVASPQAQIELNAEEGRRSALSILSNQGISLNPQIVPQVIAHYEQLILPDRETEPTLAQNLLGAVSSFDLGGNVIRYESDMGSIRFHSGGEFSAQFSPSAFSLLEQSPQSHGDTILNALELDAQLVETVSDETSTQLIYRQLWDGVPLLDYGFTLLYQDDALASLSDAKRLCGSSTPEGNTSFSVSTALMQFLIGLQELGDICRTIDAITPAYRATTNLAGTIHLTPLWCIETDTGSYQLNLITGALLRI